VTAFGLVLLVGGAVVLIAYRRGVRAEGEQRIAAAERPRPTRGAARGRRSIPRQYTAGPT
jgi:hypothetical protein